MLLFLTIVFVCLLFTFAVDIVKVLMKTPPHRNIYSAELQQELNEALAELERLRQNATTDGEYAYFVKKMRAERKLKDVQERINVERNLRQLKDATSSMIAGYILKAVLSLILLVISIRNRYTPVMVFNERFNLQPLEGLLSFPTGVPNAISVPVWVLSCNLTFRVFSGFIKNTK